MSVDITYPYLAAVLTLMVVYALFRRIRARRIPPGPRPLPLVGNAVQLHGALLERFFELSIKYGPVFSIYIGTTHFVVVSDLANIKDVLLKRDTVFAGCPKWFYSGITTRNWKGIIAGQCTNAWERHRKISHSALSMFREGIENLEGQMLDRVSKLAHIFKSYSDKPVDIADDVDCIIASFMCKVVFGHYYERHDDELKTLLETLHFFMAEDPFAELLDYIPSLQFLRHIYTTSHAKRVERAVKIRDSFFEEKLRQARLSFKEGSVKNYMDALLQAAQEEETIQDEINSSLARDLLIMSIFDIFIAGWETTSSSIKWIILYMTVWPEIQQRVYEEVEKIVGKPSSELSVCLKHRKLLPYTDATIMETLRFSSVTNLGLWHKTLADTTLYGYKIPKGTRVILNYYQVHHSEKHFKDPFGFHPERFLGKDGNVSMNQNAAYLPFTMGPRNSLGEVLAKSEVFLLTANLIHQFRFSLAPDTPHPDLKPLSGLTLYPRPYNVVINSRIS